MGWSVAVIYLAMLSATQAQDYANNESIKLFQQYVQINSTTNSDLTKVVEFWTQLAEDVGVEITKYEFTTGYPVLVIKWPGSDSSLRSIMLNSHMDVVPANEDEGWTYPPFSGFLDAEGVIWGRGTQDMKSVSLQYFEALRRLKSNGTLLLRDVYMTLMPDEEVGGENGIISFLKTEAFAAMNVGFELDEGTSYDLPVIPVFYQDKVVWQIQVDCYAPSGHSSTFPETNATATGKCYNVIKKMFEFRDEEYAKYEAAGIYGAGTYTSVNLNIIEGGTANNVIPGHVSLVFDIRLSTTLNEETFDAQLREWISEAGPNVTLSYIEKDEQSPATVISDQNPYWSTFASAASQMNIVVVPIVPPGSTDGRHVRDAGYPALGFSPMPNTELLLHSVDERLSAATFLNGIDIYEGIIQALANIPGSRTESDPSVYVVDTTLQN